jgi:hypothetical protein
MSQTNIRIGALQIGIIVLTAATALIHLQRGIAFGMPMFIANGIGYIALVTALYAPIAFLAPYRKWVRWGLIAYTIVTIVGWLAIGDKTEIVGIADKIIEVALVVLLVFDMRQNK